MIFYNIHRVQYPGDYKMEDQKDLPNVYEFRLRILGNEIVAMSIGSSSTSNKWIALGLLSMFSLLLIFGEYGDKFIDFYNRIGN